ncbi:MAG: VacB/RNase II family 3'-5' exoribonuclease [Deltaproteobacteria bacterium]|nr:VacB/RNase II family 3'-5' exoribonuclease [Deltaproteobacteria bacterium]
MTIPPERVLRALDRRQRPLLTTRALLRAVGGERGELRALHSTLRRLVGEGKVERLEGRYRLARNDVLLEGVVDRAREGRLRVVADDGSSWTVEGDLAPGVRVLVEPRPDEPGRAELVRAIGGPRGEIVGVLLREGSLVPWREDPRSGAALHLPRAAWRGARPGDVVAAERVETARGQRRPRRPGLRRGRRSEAPPPPDGRVVEVLGPLGTPDADFRAIVWRHRLPLEFPAAALAEAEALDPAEAAGGAGRLDLREHPFVTIDPASARDHDDAVFVEPRPARGPGGAADRLWVAIADVAGFVPEGSALDAEARRRGNSVYFPDRAIPMLPERLSGELCSLRPGADRPVLAVALDVARDGSVRRARFHEARIRSRARLVYDDAAAVMEGGETPAIRDREVQEQLHLLAAVARRLTARRFAAGAIDFDLPTAEIVLGDEGRPTDIVEAPRTIANRAIEEAMLAANRAVAEHLLARDVPALFRVHEPPLPEQLEALRELLASLGLLDARAREGPLAAIDIQRAVQRAAGRPEERLVNSVALRSLRQARYDHVNRGHFALAFEAYLHFTSPIRRYADLVVHRQLRDLLAGGPAARARIAARGERLAGSGAALSFCERAAMEAERDAVDLKKCVFLRERVGERFAATVTRASRHGLHVTLDPFFVEGLVPIRTLPGRWDFDEQRYAWTARGGRERLSLGDRVEVALTRVEMLRGWIDFVLVRRLARPA